MTGWLRRLLEHRQAESQRGQDDLGVSIGRARKALHRAGKKLGFPQFSPASMKCHKPDGVHARCTHLETETLREAINKLPSIPD